MPKPLKFPGLQPKFERALQTILAKEALSGSDIREELKARADEFELSAPELADLLGNFANYIARAKEADLVRSGGPWAGYQLSRVNPPPLAESPRAPIEELRQAIANLRRQPNFGNRPLVESLGVLVSERAVPSLFMAALEGETLTKKQWDEFSADLAGLQRLLELARATDKADSS